MIWSVNGDLDTPSAPDPGGDLEPLGPYAHLASCLGPLPALQRRLDGCATLGELLAVASCEGPRVCGFERGLVLSVIDGYLSSNGMEPLEDPASDSLRRHCEAQPIALLPGSEEAEVIRRAHGGRRERATSGSVIAQVLGLDAYAVAAVVPESHALALVVLDRPEPAVGEEDRAVVELFAHLLGLAVTRVVLRLRIHELSHEIRHLTSSANALMHEAQVAPIALTTDLGQGQVFTTAGQRSAPPSSALSELLSERERSIAALMVDGRSNREIGEELHVAPDTVKAHVARVLRKLQASNRVEAVARYIELQRPAQ
jgi:DNA-binding CsgD family transcriptional regulator